MLDKFIYSAYHIYIPYGGIKSTPSFLGVKEEIYAERNTTRYINQACPPPPAENHAGSFR